MLNNIFLDAEFEKKITEMTIEAIEANDIGASLVPLQILLYINSVKAFGADGKYHSDFSIYAQDNANGISNIVSGISGVANGISGVANQLSTVINSLSTISTQLGSMDTKLQSMDTKLQSVDTKLQSMDTSLKSIDKKTV